MVCGRVVKERSVIGHLLCWVQDQCMSESGCLTGREEGCLELWGMDWGRKIFMCTEVRKVRRADIRTSEVVVQ